MKVHLLDTLDEIEIESLNIAGIAHSSCEPVCLLLRPDLDSIEIAENLNDVYTLLLDEKINNPDVCNTGLIQTLGDALKQEDWVGLARRKAN